MWLLLAISGYTFLAVVFILDKIIVSQEKVKPVEYTFYSTVFLIVSLLALPLAKSLFLTGWFNWFLALVSGLSFGLGLYFFYLALQYGETTHISPFNGSMVSIFIFILSYLFLNEKLNLNQQIGVILLIFASYLFSQEKTKKHNGFHIGFVWAIISGLFFAVSQVTAKYLYSLFDFWLVFAWSKAAISLSALIFAPFLFRKKKKKTKHSQQKKTKKQNKLVIILSDKILGIIAVILLQLAYAQGLATVVGALSGLQFALIFVFVFLLTKLKPQIFKEYFTKKEIYEQIGALVLVILGLIFIVI